MTHEDAVSSRLREETMALMAYSPTVSLLNRIPFDKGVVGDCHEAARAAIRLGDEPVVDLAMFAQRTEERPGEANTRTVLGTLDYLLRGEAARWYWVLVALSQEIGRLGETGVDPSCRSPIRVAVQSIPLDEDLRFDPVDQFDVEVSKWFAEDGPSDTLLIATKAQRVLQALGGLPESCRTALETVGRRIDDEEERRAAGYRPSTTLSRRMPLDV